MAAPRYLQKVVNRILLVLDGEGDTSESVHYAANLAMVCDASVFVLRVLRLPTGGIVEPSLMTGRTFVPQAIWSKMREDAQEELREAVLSISQFGVQVDHRLVVTLKPVETLVGEAIHQEGCDMVVMAEAPRKGLRRLLMKSNAARVLEGSDRPVIIVR